MKETIIELTKSEYAYNLIKRIGRRSYKQVLIKNKKGSMNYQVLYKGNVSLSMREGSDTLYVNFALTGAKTQELIELIKEIEYGGIANVNPNHYLPRENQYNPTFFQTIKRKIHEYIRYCKNRKG